MELYRKTDFVLYQTKSGGRNGYWDLRKQAVKMIICNEMHG